MEVISVSGIGSTGSGAVEALLQEYEDVQGGMKDEFDLIYRPDGILDLEYHLCQAPERFFSSDVAISRFVHFLELSHKEPHGYYNNWTNFKFYEISMKYVESIIQVKWHGYWGIDEFSSNNFWRTVKYRLFERRFLAPIQIKKSKKINSFLDRTMYLSVEPDDFIDKTKQYLTELFTEMGYDVSKPIFVNQLIAGNDPCAGMQYFDAAKCIVVDRDPRDIYMMHHKQWCVICHWCPTDDVEEFVQYYRCCRRKVVDDERVLRVQYEDLIYRYDETVKQIEDFLGIKDHTKKRQVFNPDISINCTQLFLGVGDMKERIKYIEEKLPEYIYDFSKYPPKEATLDRAF